MPIWTLAKKELRLLLRDRFAAVILLAMPLIFILVLGLLLGEGFGQKPDDRLRVSLVDLDAGKSGLDGGESWARVVQRDLAETADIKVEIIRSLPEAERLVRDHKRAAVLVFGPHFSDEVGRCSFLADGLNPFHRDGVYFDKVDVRFLRDGKQPGAASIIEQVAQVSLLRVLLPWMIGKAFERLSDQEFIKLLGERVNLPLPNNVLVRGFFGGEKVQLKKMLDMAAGTNEKDAEEYRRKVGMGVQDALREQFKNYNLTGKTWASLTKSLQKGGDGAEVSAYVNRDGSGLLNRGAQRYQLLVPAYTVMFAFFLVMNVGWVFVAERRQGTLKRLRAAPVTRGQVLVGKLIPCFLLSLGQGVFLLVAGRLFFGMRWGPEHWPLVEQVAWLLPVVFTTSMAAMGLALLVAAVARTEIQVALYGAVPVLILALIGGCVLPREMMPEEAQKFSQLTPQGWALDAYRELLDADPRYDPNLAIVLKSCGVLAAFGVGFLGLAWGLLRLE
jgi:ABC-type multidrug transport system permease subunit